MKVKETNPGGDTKNSERIDGQRKNRNREERGFKGEEGRDKNCKRI